MALGTSQAPCRLLPLSWARVDALPRLVSGMTIPEEDADVGQGSKYCLVAIGRLQVRRRSRPFPRQTRASRHAAQCSWGPLRLAPWGEDEAGPGSGGGDARCPSVLTTLGARVSPPRPPGTYCEADFCSRRTCCRARGCTAQVGRTERARTPPQPCASHPHALLPASPVGPGHPWTSAGSPFLPPRSPFSPRSLVQLQRLLHLRGQNPPSPPAHPGTESHVRLSARA